LFACPNWPGIVADIENLPDDLVSLILVADPFGDWTPAMLRRSFPDRALPFKQHFVVDLSNPVISPHHQRNIARARQVLHVEAVSDPPTLLDQWAELYEYLIHRHGIDGIATFSRESFARQLAVPGLVALRAVRSGQVVGVTLWYVAGTVGYYHLGAYTDMGYRLGASFALFAHALEHFAADGLAWLSLGAGSGVKGDPSDGLSRFKRGWSTETRPAYFCGRILSPHVYSRLSGEHTANSFFPAYRSADE